MLYLKYFECYKIHTRSIAIWIKMHKIMFLGDEVIYLDPHTTQKSGSIEDKTNEEEIEMDATYHCKTASRMPITDMDPSVALVSI